MPAKKTKKSKAGSAKKKSAARKVKYTYAFGKKTDGNSTMRNLLGGKGANLAEMTRIGLPVPAGFTITTEVCTYYYAHQRSYPKVLRSQMEAGVANMDRRSWASSSATPRDPLLLAVRSGARDSMPGMMDTVLNLGLNDATVASLAKATSNERFAWDCYRRFIQMYGDVVLGVQKRPGEDHEPFEHIIETYKEKTYGEDIVDSDLTAEDNMELVNQFKALVKRRTGRGFPDDPWEQLEGAAGAVFSSWMNDRAIVYRRKYGIPAEWGTAVNIQAMVFGNTGDDSGSGVAFTRNPANGANELYGEFLVNAQGEDVVAGVRTPDPVSGMAKALPKAYKDLLKIRRILEQHFKDVQDVEFTIQEGKLYMLQTRNGKRTGLAAVRIAVEMNKERLMNQESAVKKIPADSISSLLAPVFDPKSAQKATKIAEGLPAGPGAASGKLVFSAAGAERLASEGHKVILCRVETSPEDLRGMLASEGILTSRGGVSSHAALVARQMGKVCIVGASALQIDYSKGTLTVGKTRLSLGDDISIDGTTGEVFAGHVDTLPSEVNQVLEGKLKAEKSYTYQLFETVMKWADKYRRLKVRTNADTPGQSKMAGPGGRRNRAVPDRAHVL
jgi:pyruvate,orthophosphate dikinase